jgi:hydroxymethylglutaryl-CoA reductase
MAIYTLADIFPVCSPRLSEEELPSARRVNAETLGCYGNGKSKRFAEIIAAAAMAGEISLMTSIVNGTYIYAHDTFGRNRPPSKSERVGEGI